jgi:GH24 family phage-related lysozyme (muramidase)
MSDLSFAINLIRKYEGFNEKAYPDQLTGAEPYSIGFGTQFYPDGSPVKKEQLCSREKALEYLFHEVNIIDVQLSKLNLEIDSNMHQALISFIHSIGWNSFLYSSIIDSIEQEHFNLVVDEIGRWIFDAEYHAIGSLLNRRREEIALFLKTFDGVFCSATKILLGAFQDYTATPHEVDAILDLENAISPYVLTNFSNEFYAKKI